MRQLPERDWKYMQGLKPALLERYCSRVNARTAVLLADTQSSQHERYVQAYRHVHDADRIVADCFDDWRRSTLFFKIGYLRKHDLFTPEEYAGLSEECRDLTDVLLHS